MHILAGNRIEKFSYGCFNKKRNLKGEGSKRHLSFKAIYTQNLIVKKNWGISRSNFRTILKLEDLSFDFWILAPQNQFQSLYDEIFNNDRFLEQ